MSVNISDLRVARNEEPFLEEHLVSKEPFAQFDAWFRQASANPQIREPNAMCLSTATKDGRVSARFVLLKSYGKDGFKFFTNYGHKGQVLAENPFVAANLYWEPINRAVRMEGTAEKVPLEESEKYFHERPLASQLAALVCPQSKPVASRESMCKRMQELEVEYGGNVPRPELWGGYVIRPTMVEFFMNQPNRLSDRIRFRRPELGEVADGVLLHEGEDGWVYERLAP